MMSVNVAILQISKPEGDSGKEARLSTLREKQPDSIGEPVLLWPKQKRCDVDRGTSHKH